MTRDWRKLRNEEVRDLYFSINVIRLIKSRIVRLSWGGGHLGCIQGLGGGA